MFQRQLHWQHLLQHVCRLDMAILTKAKAAIRIGTKAVTLELSPAMIALKSGCCTSVRGFFSGWPRSQPKQKCSLLQICSVVMLMTVDLFCWLLLSMVEDTMMSFAFCNDPFARRMYCVVLPLNAALHGGTLQQVMPASLESKSLVTHPGPKHIPRNTTLAMLKSPMNANMYALYRTR